MKPEELDIEEKRGLLASPLSDISAHSDDASTEIDQDPTPPSTRQSRKCTSRRLWVISIATVALLGLGLTGLHQSGTIDSQQISEDAKQQLSDWSDSVKTWLDSVSNSTTVELEPAESSDPAAPEETSDETYDVDEATEEEAEEAEETSDGVSQTFKDFAPGGIVDTLPPFPQEILAAPGDSSERYLAYLPHSGFHNQRGEFTNAATLARVLNRTLITPHARLGKPISWTSKDALEERQMLMQKAKLVNACSPYLEELEDGTEQFTGPGPCRFYHKTTEMTWPLMTDLSTMVEGTRLLPRDDMDPAWFTTPVDEGGLGLSEDDIYRFQDEDRYSYRIYDDSSMETLESRFTSRINLDDLYETPYADKRLLYFGSMFSGGRLVFSKKDNHNMYQTMIKALTFRNDLLDSIAIDIGHHLGGRENYIGLHLRVGDGAFKVNAGLNMRNTWNMTCIEVFGLSEERCTSLGEENGDFQPTAPWSRRSRMYRRRASERHAHIIDSSPFSATDGLTLDDFSASAQSHSTSLTKRQVRAIPRPGYTSDSDLPMMSSLQCQRPLYTDPELIPFNRPVYIATDSHHPREDPNLQVYFKTFPCAFVLDDFIDADPYNSQPLPDLAGLFELRSKFDGVKMAQFLLAFLEAEVASRSMIATYGTQGSTFSQFARDTLHEVYAQDEEEY